MLVSIIKFLPNRRKLLLRSGILQRIWWQEQFSTDLHVSILFKRSLSSTIAISFSSGAPQDKCLSLHNLWPCAFMSLGESACGGKLLDGEQWQPQTAKMSHLLNTSSDTNAKCTLSSNSPELNPQSVSHSRAILHQERACDRKKLGVERDKGLKWLASFTLTCDCIKPLSPCKI